VCDHQVSVAPLHTRIQPEALYIVCVCVWVYLTTLYYVSMCTLEQNKHLVTTPVCHTLFGIALYTDLSTYYMDG